MLLATLYGVGCGLIWMVMILGTTVFFPVFLYVFVLQNILKVTGIDLYIFRRMAFWNIAPRHRRYRTDPASLARIKRRYRISITMTILCVLGVIGIGFYYWIGILSVGIHQFFYGFAF